MKHELTNRNFERVVAEKYQNERGVFTRIVQQSSGIGDYDNSMGNPGSSFLWVGQDHHLNREQVGELIDILQNWIDTGKLNKES